MPIGLQRAADAPINRSQDELVGYASQSIGGGRPLFAGSLWEKKFVSLLWLGLGLGLGLELGLAQRAQAGCTHKPAPGELSISSTSRSAGLSFTWIESQIERRAKSSHLFALSAKLALRSQAA